MTHIGPTTTPGGGILGLELPSWDHWRWRYYDDDRWSLPPGVLDRPDANVDQSASLTPAQHPTQSLIFHPFAAAFTPQFDEVDLG